MPSPDRSPGPPPIASGGAGPLDATAAASLDAVYSGRFDTVAAEAKRAMWNPIVRHLERWIDPAQPVLDLACDHGDFIANVRAEERWASDIRDVRAHLPPEVRFVQADGRALAERLPGHHFGTVFVSNYLEHLPSPEAVIEQLRVIRALVAPTGRVIVLQPNIRLIGGAYWHFIDHRTPLTERSLVEAATMTAFATEALIVRYLPYTTKSRLPANPRLVRLYLAVRPAWWLLGRQTLWVGRPAGG